MLWYPVGRQHHPRVGSCRRHDLQVFIYADFSVSLRGQLRTWLQFQLSTDVLLIQTNNQTSSKNFIPDRPELDLFCPQEA